VRQKNRKKKGRAPKNFQKFCVSLENSPVFVSSVFLLLLLLLLSIRRRRRG
jgi:hypothetical protein